LHSSLRKFVAIATDIKYSKMPIKKYSPVTPGTRFRVGNSYSEITTNKPEKSLTVGLKKSGGRNHSGKMTMRNRGGGHKRKYRIIDFKRNKDSMTATVKTIEYDPNRTAYIALVPGQGAAIARSAGTYATLMSREGKYAVIKMPSG